MKEKERGDQEEIISLKKNMNFLNKYNKALWSGLL